MTKIGLLSDTHSSISDSVIDFLKDSDEIWHAGDWGNNEVYSKLKIITPTVRGVYGNIDGPNLNEDFKEKLIFYCENVKVLITHIGGYPKKYQPSVKKDILNEKIQLFISGHSHILKVIYDQENKCLHLNPGAAGSYGFHKISTAMRFQINDTKIENLEIFEIPKFK